MLFVVRSLSKLLQTMSVCLSACLSVCPSTFLPTSHLPPHPPPSLPPSRPPSPSLSTTPVDKALDSLNTALDGASNQQIFSALQSKEASFPFVYADHQERYVSGLKKERKEGIPKNVLVSRGVCVLCTFVFFRFLFFFVVLAVIQGRIMSVHV